MNNSELIKFHFQRSNKTGVFISPYNLLFLKGYIILKTGKEFFLC